MTVELASSLAAVTTRPTTESAELPLSTYVWAMTETALVLAAGVALFWTAYGRKRLAWGSPRVLDRRQAGPLWVGGAVMVWLFLLVPTLLTISTRDSATTRAAGADGTVVAMTAITYVAGLAIVALLHLAWRGNSLRMLGLSPLPRTLAPGKAIASAAVALPLTYFVAAGSMLVWQLVHLQHESTHAMLQLMERNETSPWVLGLTILNATLLAPLYEELLFRGHFQTALTSALPRWRWPAIVITSVLFAGMHDGWTMPAMFVLSCAIGAAYEWSGSLWVAIAIHVAFNAMSTVSFLGSH